MRDDADCEPLSFGRFEIRPQSRQVLVDGRPVRIGARSFDLLQMLVRHRDRVVSKHELLAHVWPGLVVEENNLPVHVLALRKVFGADTIATVPGRGYRFTALTAANVPSDLSPDAVPGNVQTPDHLNDALRPKGPKLFGRDAELKQLLQAIERHSLVTVLGPGGIGKTSIALAAVDELRTTFADGACVVEFASLQDATLVPAAVATALHLRTISLEVPDTLVQSLAQRAMLLVLDNCEHLIGAVAQLAIRLHAGAPGVRLLATSQLPIDLPHEIRFRLEPLTLPESHDLDVARQSSAIAMFEAQVKAVAPNFALNDENIEPVIEICRQLDGIPLALEMAAVRVPLLGAAGLAVRLDDRFQVLTHGRRLASARHQTLLATLDWSYRLLTAQEQAILRRLAIFPGSFSVDAVQAVLADPAMNAWTVLDLFGRLVDKSLVVALASAPADMDAGVTAPPRFRLLETVRSFAAEQLRQTDEREALRGRHAHHLLSWSRAHAFPCADDLTIRYKPAMAEQEVDNLRDCLDWAQDNDVGLALQLAAAWSFFWRERGHHGEALRRGAYLLSLNGGETPSQARGELLLGLSSIAYEQGDAALSKRYADLALETFEVIGGRAQIGHCHLWQCSALTLQGRWREALGMVRQGLAIFRSTGHRERIASGLVNEACILCTLGQAAESLPLLQEGADIYRALNDVWGQGLALENLGEALYALEDYQAARAAWGQGLALFRPLGHQHRLASLLHHIGCAELMLGQLETAQNHCAESLRIGQNHGFLYFQTSGVSSLARHAQLSGQPARAASLFGALDALRQRGVDLIDPIETRELPTAQLIARSMLGDAAWMRSWLSGAALSLDSAVKLALQDLVTAG
jgi:predicted ATPase/DNA-binding winged helix-turn-helix (wHTH) protein